MCSHPSGKTWDSRSGGSNFSSLFWLATTSPSFMVVPEDDDCGEEVHAGHPVMLAFGGPVADVTTAMEADSMF